MTILAGSRMTVLTYVKGIVWQIRHRMIGSQNAQKTNADATIGATLVLSLTIQTRAISPLIGISESDPIAMIILIALLTEQLQDVNARVPAMIVRRDSRNRDLVSDFWILARDRICKLFLCSQLDGLASMFGLSRRNCLYNTFIVVYLLKRWDIRKA